MKITYQTPPECIRVCIKVLIFSFLSQVYQERGQDEAQEANIPGSNQLLQDHQRTEENNYNSGAHLRKLSCLLAVGLRSELFHAFL